MAIVVDKKLAEQEACSAALEFTKLYYDCLDKKRTLLSKLYMDTATMVWNGNSVIGCAEIQKFLEKIPPSTHIISSLDAQPLHDDAIKGQKTIMVVVVGTARYEKNESKPFLQNFLVTVQETKWKIASDCFRYQEVVQT